MDFKVIERPTILPRAGSKYEVALKAVFETVTSGKAIRLDLPVKDHEKFKNSLHYHAKKRKLGTRSAKDGESLIVWAFVRPPEDPKKKK